MNSARPFCLAPRPIPKLPPPTRHRATSPQPPGPIPPPAPAAPDSEANRERALGLLAYGLQHPGTLLLLLLGWLFVPTPLSAQSAGGVDLWPRDTTVDVGSSRQFGAYVPLNPNTVTWLVNDLPGGNSTVGTISASGLYQAPTVAPTPSTVTIRAQSTAYATAWAATTLKVTRKYPWLWSVSKVGGGTFQVGNFEVSLNGSNFAPDSVVTANGTDLPTTYFSPTKLTAVGSAAAAGTIQIAVRQPAPGAVTGNAVSITVSGAPIIVSLSPASLSLPLGANQAFVATVSGSTNPSVTWTVNGVIGGNAALGFISPAGLYSAPPSLPAANPVSVRATSVANPLVFAQASVTLVAPPPPVSVTVVPTTASVSLGATQTLTATVTGSPNTAVTWSVNGINGGNATVGTVNSSGLYTAPASLPAGGSVTVTATSTVNPSGSASAILTLVAPPPPVLVSLSAARFLEQASFGPTPASLALVQQQGIPAWLQAQFALPATAFPIPAGNSVQELQRWMLHNYTTAPDQLRQRVIYALSQIVVTSASKLVYADEMLPWLNALREHAFGNYRDLLRDVTKTSSMGKYLDLANSSSQASAAAPTRTIPANCFNCSPSDSGNSLRTEANSSTRKRTRCPPTPRPTSSNFPGRLPAGLTPPRPEPRRTTSTTSTMAPLWSRGPTITTSAAR